MAVRIRMRRIGKNPKGKIHWRITVFDERVNRDGRFIEELGFYNPGSKQTKVDLERFGYWLSKGAQPTMRVQAVVKKYKKSGVVAPAVKEGTDAAI
jgi:small subunit ribosomal protein S16